LSSRSLVASAAAFVIGVVGAAQAEIRINRHGMNMEAPEQPYDVTIVKGVRIKRMRPLATTSAVVSGPLPQSPAEAIPPKPLLHPELIRSAAASVGSRYDGVLRRLGADHLPRVLGASRRHGVPADLIMAVIAVESNGREDAVSPKGARGLMQLMPATAADLGVEDAFDPEQNIDGGARLLSRLLDRYEGDPVLTLAAYNAGEGAVAEHKGVPPYKETQDYIPRVLGTIAAARRAVLSATPAN
jgi:soluble lytic murein transglycosylase-like protein